METLGLGDANHDIPMQRSIPVRPNSLGSKWDEETDIWRIHWSWRQGNGSGSYTELFDNRRSFERRLFELALQADSNTHAIEGSVEKRRWIDVLMGRKEVEKGDPDREQFKRCDRITRVEHLQDGEWVLHRWGVSAPKLAVEEQV